VATQFQIEKHINIEKSIEFLKTDKVLKVGWTKKNRYHEEQGGQYVAEVAAQNEYGVPYLRIPARPFMGPAVIKNSFKWMAIVKTGAKDVIEGNKHIETVLDEIGAVAAFDIKKAITAVTSPPLAPSTIQARFDRLTSKSAKRRGITKTLEKPLIDTGLMFASVTHVIEANE